MPHWFSDTAFADAFGEYPLRVTERRHLACTCQHQRALQAQYFQRRVLRVYPEDCTQSNAVFLLRNADVLQVEDDVCLLPLLQLCRMYAYRYDPDPVVMRVIPHEKSLTGAFFLGRMLARHCSGTFAVGLGRHEGQTFPDDEDLIKFNVTKLLRHLDQRRDCTPYIHEESQKEKTAWAVMAGTHYEAARRHIYDVEYHAERSDGPRYHHPAVRLNLSHFLLDDAGVEALRGMIRTNVQELFLYNTLTSLSNGLYGSICRGEIGRKLYRLELDNNARLGHFTGGAITLLCKAVREDGLLHQLQWFSLVDCTLDARDMRELALCFQFWRHLRHLDLSDNPFGGRGMRHFMAHGKHLSRLQELILFDLHPQLTWRDINHFAIWIADECEWLCIEEIRLFPDDPGNDPGGIGEPDADYRRANAAVQSAMKFCSARGMWNIDRPELDSL